MTEQLDTQGEAREALSSMVTNYSKRILSDPRMLGNLATDLLPDLPRERNLLVTAAESDVAGELRRHVEEHHLDPDTAVQLVARSLTDRTALDPSAAMWVTKEYAQALGYRVRSDVAPPPSQPIPPPLSQTAPPTPPPADYTVTSFGQYGSPQQATSPPQEPAPGYPGGYPGGYPPAGPPQQGPPPWQPPVQPPPKKRNRWPLFAGVGTAAVVVIAVVAVVASGALNSPKPKPTSSPTPTLTHTATHSAAPVPRSSLASLTELLPADIDDPASQCSPPQPKFTPVGVIQSYSCNDPGLPNGVVDAYQMNSSANYLKTWAAFNKWWGFTGFTPGSVCPAPGSNHVTSEGTTAWNDKYFPNRQGQVLECEWTGTGNNPSDPSYAWTLPTENTFFVAWGGDNTSMATVQTWWTNNVVPLASPTPVALSS